MTGVRWRSQNAIQCRIVDASLVIVPAVARSEYDEHAGPTWSRCPDTHSLALPPVFACISYYR
eukprot:2663918-Prymnesium_polylepis.1